MVVGKRVKHLVWFRCYTHQTKLEVGIFVFTGNYRVEMYDKQKRDYVPTVAGLGMHVEVKDPESKVVMSRVR